MSTPVRAHLVRTYRRGTVHLNNCRQLHNSGRVVPWLWALGKTDDEIREAIARNRGTACRICRPLDDIRTAR